jgi:hypothetical protein
MCELMPKMLRLKKRLTRRARMGKARVIVVFDEPFRSEFTGVYSSCRSVTKRFAGETRSISITLRYLYTVIPGLALEADEMALLVIRDSPRVSILN